jgi:hypothetical protein
MEHPFSIRKKDLISLFFKKYTNKVLGFFLVEKGSRGSDRILEEKLHGMGTILKHKKSTFQEEM